MSISNCGHDERNRYSGGQAGDQSKTEWYIRPWWNDSWNVVLRHPDAKTRNLIADMAIKAAKNDLVGYDQSERLTFWNHLKASNYDPAQITVKCEADCSSGVAAIVKGAGYRLGNKAMQNVNPSITTWNERNALKAAGFQALTDSKYLTSDAYLLAGDVLLNESRHTAINVTNGSKSGGSSSTPVVPPASSSSGKLSVDGWWGVATTKALQKALGTTVDGIVSGQDAGNMASVNRGGLVSASWKTGRGGSQMVRALQRKIGVSADGYFGKNTCKALQRYLGTIQDGIVSAPSSMVKALQRKLNAGSF
jgi:peptidoglycan hydrolase-like protein with peptidoglycan-binding domain